MPMFYDVKCFSTIEEETLRSAVFYINKYRLSNMSSKVADPGNITFKKGASKTGLEKGFNIFFSKWSSGWTGFWGKTIYLNEFLFNEDEISFLVQVVAHELVHVHQYSGLGKIWARTFGRFQAEKEAKKIGQDVENWVRVNCLNLNPIQNY
jgi:hypothetical protein